MFYNIKGVVLWKYSKNIHEFLWRNGGNDIYLQQKTDTSRFRPNKIRII